MVIEFPLFATLEYSFCIYWSVVGCIALMRLSFESEDLAYSIINTYGSSLLHDIANLHNELRVIEQKRPIGCDYGIGVCPISRRLVLKSLTQLCMLSMETYRNESGKTIIQELLRVSLQEIVTQKEKALTSDAALFRLCESVYDLSSLHPLIVVDLLTNSSSELACVFEGVISGYSHLAFTSDTDQWLMQWARLRGAVVCLLGTCCKHTMTKYVAKAIVALQNAEIEAAIRQCGQSVSSGSNIFIDCVVGEEMLSAGAYLTVVRESLKRTVSSPDLGAERAIVEVRLCLEVLSRSSLSLTSLLLNSSAEANSYADPRPTIAEAWFQTMSALVSICKTNLSSQFSGEDGIQDIIGASLSTCIALVFMKDLGSKKSPPPAVQRGMSLDGPQTLAMTDFMAEAISLGPSILAATSRSFATHFNLENVTQNEETGGIIVAAGLLRAASGALPPWAVELTPIIFKSLYVALGSSCDALIHILANSTKIDISGDFLAGRYFESVSSVHIDSFLSKTREACNKGASSLCNSQSKANCALTHLNLLGEWNKLKSIIKTACGGKKKESGFNLKPQFTCWECERL